MAEELFTKCGGKEDCAERIAIFQIGGGAEGE
jgi:hypothetical protein